jgi:hypothetical protein
VRAIIFEDTAQNKHQSVKDRDSPISIFDDVSKSAEARFGGLNGVVWIARVKGDYAGIELGRQICQNQQE